jgi:hypothetical protein
MIFLFETRDRFVIPTKEDSRKIRDMLFDALKKKWEDPSTRVTTEGNKILFERSIWRDRYSSHPCRNISRGWVEVQQNLGGGVSVDYSLNFLKNFLYTFGALPIFFLLIYFVWMFDRSLPTLPSFLTTGNILFLGGVLSLAWLVLKRLRGNSFRTSLKATVSELPLSLST